MRKKSNNWLILFLIVILLPAGVFAQDAAPRLAALARGAVGKLPFVAREIEGDIVGVRIFGEFAAVLTHRSLVLYNAETGKEIDGISFKTDEKALDLFAIDLNQDGNLEFPVTSVSGNRLSSYIFRLTSDRRFEAMLADLPYFFRVIRQEGKAVLIGQESSSIAPFAGDVCRLVLNRGGLKKAGSVDLPKNTGIYEFAIWNGGRVWVRNTDGLLKLFEKVGRKWKVIYKSSERYRGNVNCFPSLYKDVMSENRILSICVPTPPVVFEHGGDNPYLYVIVDDHKFVLGGVMFDPAMPRKSSVHILKFDEVEGLDECGEVGPYQGYIGDYFLYPGGGADTRLIVVKNGGSKYIKGSRVEEIDIGSVQCK